MRYMQADQFLGSTFKTLLNIKSREENKITWSKFMKLRKDVDDSIRQKNDAMLYITKDEIVMVVCTYQKFFQADENYIQVSEEYIDKFKEKYDWRESYVSDLQNYFIDGIPDDILSTTYKVLMKELSKG